MPQTQAYDQAYDHFYERMIGTEYRFAWLPQRCDISGKRIWLKYGYRLTRIITGPGESIFEYRWHDKNTHIIWKLTR
jgi:hypothetical protein